MVVWNVEWSWSWTGNLHDPIVIALWVWWVLVFMKGLFFTNRPTLQSKEDLCKTEQEKLASKRQNHRERLLTALLYVPFVPASVILVPFQFKTFIILMSVKGLGEYLQIMADVARDKEQGKYERVALLDELDRLLQVLAVVEGVITFWGRFDYFCLGTFACFFMLLTLHMAMIHVGKTKISGLALQRLALHIFGFFWISWTTSHALLMLSGEQRYEYAGGVMAIMLWTSWLGDGAAYYVGNKFGYHKAFPNLSPKKSWEGTIATTVFSVVLCYLFKLLEESAYGEGLNFPPISVVHYLMIGFLISVFDVVGDICESFIKRLGGVKDSGQFFSGHGGILDRFDSFYFVAPVTTYYIHFILHNS